MKNLILVSAVALTALTGAVSAGTVNNSGTEATIHAYVPDANLSGVSDATLIHALSVIQSNDEGSESMVAAKVRSILLNG